MLISLFKGIPIDRYFGNLFVRNFSLKEVVVIIFIGRIFDILFQFWNLKRAAKLLFDQGLVIF